MKFLESLKSRKLWVTIVSLIMFFLNDQTGSPVDSANTLGAAGVAMSYLLGQSAVDAKKN